MKKRATRLDDKGFSLVELLLSIIILGIIVAPLLHSFVTSARTAKKSYDIGEVTAIAESIAEKIEANSISAIGKGAIGPAEPWNATGNTTEPWISPAPGDTSNADLYNISLNDLGNGKYTATAAILSETFYSPGKKIDVTKYTPMDAVFSQTGGGADPDAEGEAQLALKAAGYGATAVLDKQTRSIDITIAEASDRSYQYSCVYTYEARVNYDSNGDGKIDAKDTPAAISYPVGPTTFYSGTLEEGGKKLASLYFFFSTSTEKDGLYNDTVTIKHTGTTPVSIFLAAQTKTLLPTYRALVQLKDELVDTSKVFCNVPKGQYTFRVFKDEVWYERSDYTAKLVDAEPVNRLYDVTINVYPTGVKNPPPIYTLKTTKLD
ncbi:MAG: prepilin-type N-terminal cleavage/methylation domain-containing protein [Oscillospiraceae bacterium]